jgi:hypothetical protein
MATAAPALKKHQLEALQAILPASAEVSDMLRAWRGADARYWGGNLTPCWLTANIEPYGAALGSWSPSTRTLNLIPTLWRENGQRPEGAEGVLQSVAGVLIHEACHQAQGQLYRHLDAEATGPRGRWTDTSHRCPSWARAVEDVIRTEGIDLFCPVWHKSTGNQWFPWVPVDGDWRRWEKADPEATVDGRQLMGLGQSKQFMGPGLSFSQLIESLGLPLEDGKGKPIPWGI